MGVFKHVFMGTITTHSRNQYFVLALWPLILAFSIFSTDIPCGLHSPSVGRVSIEHAILFFLGIGILYELRTYWSHGWTICKVCRRTHGSLYALSLRAMPTSSHCEPCRWALLANTVDELSLQALYASSPLVSYIY